MNQTFGPDRPDPSNAIFMPREARPAESLWTTAFTIASPRPAPPIAAPEPIKAGWSPLVLSSRSKHQEHAVKRGSVRFMRGNRGDLDEVEVQRAGLRPANTVQSATARSNWRNPLPLTQTQLVVAVADRADMSRSDAKRALGALDEIVLEELGNAQKVRIGGLVQLTVRVEPAQKKRKGRNPATGEEIEIAAKPASVDLRARPLAKAKAARPSVQKARRRLAA